MRAIDARAAELGVPTRVLMENAGAAAAREIQARWAPRPTVIFCGPGANGGDGFVVARKLAEAGWPVRVGFLGDRSALKGDAADASSAWMGWVDPASAALVEPGSLIVDALFGAGLARPLDATASEIARACRGSDTVAIDLPSGVPGDGAPPEGVTFRADVTVTFLRKKFAHVLEPSRSLCGEVVVADIGAPPEAFDQIRDAPVENGPHLWTLPWPHAEMHKHARGHAMVVSGEAGRTGAARLAARAALRVGAGLVTLVSPVAAMPENAAQLTAIMLAPAKGVEQVRDITAAASATVVGPAAGLTPRTRDTVLALAADGKPVVLDADALTVFAKEPETLFEALHDNCVATPHVGEFARLFPDLADGEALKIERTRTAAQRAGCVVLLKGPDTVIAAPDGRVAVNTAGTPFLATAGSGDVLAGLIGGLVSQGMTSFEAACAGAWLHGRLGERLGAGLIAEDMPEALPALLDDLAPAHLKRR
ncbi:MAG: NAD(P)H-hydrate dehydratase [Hyphomonadaceae bacterium]|nr:NAD(P)H-hydrate dehydratase [Hyphomonadaceae bacterium]